MPNPPLWRDRSRDGSNLADAIENPGPVDPSTAVPLRAHSIATLAELRKTIGSIDGNAGPRVCLLAGHTRPMDAGAGVFVWDPTSALADNAGQTASAFTVASVQGAPVGRWRRLVNLGSAIGVTPLNSVASRWVNSLSAAGILGTSQPAFTDISGTATRAQLPDVVVGVQLFTGNGTYTPSSGVKSQIVELWGGGGGGSGAVAGTTGSACAFGLGGGAGAYARRRYAIVAGVGTGTVVIGAAGAAGAHTGAIAGAGGASTFTDGTTLLTAPGGTAGPASTAAFGTVLLAVGAAKSAAPTNADVGGQGDEGGMGIRLSGVVAISGRGGATSLGGAGQEITFNGSGNAAFANSGSGGSGGLSFTTGSPQTGGAGATGYCVITEYA